MERLVAELKRSLSFKDDTNEGDLVVVAAREPQLLIYALVGPIERVIEIGRASCRERV